MIYLTPLIERNIFGYLHLVISQDVLFTKSLVLTNLFYLVYMIISVFFAYLIPNFSTRISRKNLNSFAMFVGGISLLAISFGHSKYIFLLAMIGIGISWSSLNSIPFAMIAHRVEQTKIGFYMGLFNVVVCLPQIIVSLIGGMLLKSLFHNDVSFMFILAGCSFLLAAFLAAFYVDDQ